jgi:DNA (cytosine-5)-methyltransferase 1
MDSGPLTTLSLYSGAGGLDLGFQRAGFEIAWANDFDADACRTYSANLGDHTVCADVLGTRPPGDIDARVVIGGPPCQGFSVIGRMNRNDPRSRHVFHFLDVVEESGADAFVLENVKALGANPRWAPIRKALLSQAASLGFTTKIYILNASHYGVPQARERMFMVGLKGGRPQEPRPTTAEQPATVRQALKALPPYGEPGNDGIVAARVIPAQVPVMRPTAYKGCLLFNGSGRPLHLDSPAKTLPASMGGNATPIIDQEELADGAEPWVVDYHRRLREGGKPLKRAPKRLRRLTVQEAAALQTFPPSFKFEGPQGSQFRQIGNAVPPELAFHVANALRASIEARDDASVELALAA